MIDFSSKKALLIEDMAEARILQKKMLSDFGFKHVEVAMKAETAIELLRNNTYDVVLSDYNLGSGKDGQQLLEEVRYSGLIPHTSTYLMVTAETSLEMVMGAIEYQPDGYITKPFSQALLQRRLNKLLQNKEIFKPINQALDAGNHVLAIAECEKIMASHTFLRGKCQRLMGESYIELGKLDHAENIFNQALEERNMPWAYFGLAKVLFFREKYSQSCKKFKQLTLDNRFFVNAYDWLAKCYIKLNKFQDAQTTLLDAITKSPKNILRQMELGRVSLILKDYAMAEMSFRKAIFLAKHSILNSPDIYLSHLKSIQGLASEGKNTSKLLENFLNSQQKIDTLFNDNIEATSEKLGLQVQYFQTIGDKNNLKKTMTSWKALENSGQALPPPKELLKLL